MKILLTAIMLISSFVCFGQTANDYYKSAKEKQKNGDNKGAVDDYSKSIQIDSTNSKVYCDRGSAKMKLGNNRGALEDFNKVIEVDTNNFDAYYNRAFIEGKFGNVNEALVDYN